VKNQVEFPQVAELISNTKKVFLNTADTPLPPSPIYWAIPG